MRIFSSLLAGFAFIASFLTSASAQTVQFNKIFSNQTLAIAVDERQEIYGVYASTPATRSFICTRAGYDGVNSFVEMDSSEQAAVQNGRYFVVESAGFVERKVTASDAVLKRVTCQGLLKRD